MTGSAPETSLSPAARERLGSADVVVVETNTHAIPHFNGHPYNDDPLLFMEAFQDAADENNWTSEERKLARVRLALKGAAKDWYRREIQLNPPSTFELGSDSFIARFKKAYVTARWVAHYSMSYHSMRQQPNQSAPDYVNAKLAMAHKYETALNTTLPDEKKICDILQGLRESYMRWISNDAMPTTLSGLMDVISQLETQISVIREEAQLTAGPIVNQQPHPFVQQQGLLQDMQHQPMISSEPAPVFYASNDYKRPPVKDKQLYDPSSKSNKKKEPKREAKDVGDLENAIANMMDRMEATVLRAVETVAEKTAARFDQRDHCYNCGENGHQAALCQKPCNVCKADDHTSYTCPERMKRYSKKGREAKSDPDFQTSRQ